MVNIYIQGQLLDQYGDEVIEITSSVLDVSDLTKNTGDFSKTFTIPASPTNNKHFQHWYNASIDDGFDARTKVEGHIDIDGVPFKTGKWRLSEAIFKDGVIDGYIINFFGNLPNIKDTLGDDLLSDINFVKYNHEWNGASVMEGLKGDLNSATYTDRELVYTPMSTKRYFYDSEVSAFDYDENNIQIAFNSSVGNGSGIKWNDLRPSIKAKTIIDNIQHKYGAGTKQVVKIDVTQIATSSGSIALTLNGIEKSFAVSPATATATASSINSFVGVLFGSYVTSSVLGSVVTITSLEMAQEINPVYQIVGADDLELNVYVDEVGAYAYENPIVFSDDFFHTSEFEQMYLWLKKDDGEDVGLNENIVEWNLGDLTNIDSETNTITLTSVRTLSGGVSNQSYELVTLVTSDVAGFGNTPFTIVRKTRITDVDGNVSNVVSEHVADVGADGNVNEVTLSQVYRDENIGTTVYEVQYFVRSNTSFKINIDLQRTPYTITGTGSPVAGTLITASSRPSETSIAYAVVSDLMPKMKVSEFLKGIFDMFKLVIVPQRDGSMMVNSLDSFYDQGNRYDISDKVDYSTFKVKRGELYQSIAYQFEDPSTILNEEFQNRATDKQSYGSSIVNVYESVRPIKLIDGEKVEIKLPFEQVVFERLTDLNVATSNEPINISIGTIADKDLKPVTPKPLLHYISEQDISVCPIRFVDEDNTKHELNTTMLMPMNQFGTVEPAYSLLFESEFSCWDGTVLENNLYTLHHEDYIEAVFKLKRRSFEYEALLPTQLVTRLGLNDVLTVEGIDYRINKFKHNLLEGTTKLDLINGFDTSIYKKTAKSYSTGFFIPSKVNMSKYRSKLCFNVPRASSDYNVGKIDTGDGKLFLTVSAYGTNNNMMCLECNSINTTGVARSCQVRFDNTITGVTTYVTVTQLPNG
tara:strand:- start:223 stop:2988 length:2766 start_codon:yes stop_codon:yes gene_type:complete